MVFIFYSHHKYTFRYHNYRHGYCCYPTLHCENVKEGVEGFYSHHSGADPGFDQEGAPDHDRPKLPTVRSSIMRAKRALFSMGSALGPRKLLGISLLNMHSLHFGVPFYTIFEIIKY